MHEGTHTKERKLFVLPTILGTMHLRSVFKYIKSEVCVFIVPSSRNPTMKFFTIVLLLMSATVTGKK